MLDRDLMKVSPLKILERSSRRGLGQGNLGVLMAQAGVGKTACLIHIALEKILRQGKRQQIEVTIGRLPSDDELAQVTGSPAPVKGNRLGVEVTELTAEQQKELDIAPQTGVLVTGVQDGPASDAGIREGDVILMVNNVTVKGVAEFEKLMDGLPSGKSVAILVQRENGPMFLAFKLPEE